MDRGTIKTSTVLVATRGQTSIYRNVDEVPAELRKTVLEKTQGRNSVTIVMADRRGVLELLHARRVALAAARLRAAASQRRERIGSLLLRRGMQAALAGVTGGLIWLLLRKLEH